MISKYLTWQHIAYKKIWLRMYKPAYLRFLTTTGLLNRSFTLPGSWSLQRGCRFHCISVPNRHWQLVRPSKELRSRQGALGPHPLRSSHQRTQCRCACSKPGNSLTQIYSCGLLQSRITVKSVKFTNIHSIKVCDSCSRRCPWTFAP